MGAGAAPLGSLAPESDRALVVIAPDGELAVGLRESVERSRVVVKDARPGEARSALESCRPWPWMVVGSVPDLRPEVVSTLMPHPVILLWLGAPPPGLPSHVRGFVRFSALAAAVGRALEAEVGGMRLEVGAGVRLPSGRISRSPDLQALVSAHPGGFHLPLETFRSARRVLLRHGLAVLPQRDPATGLVSLR
ncbi:MAG: hypothetical protein ACLQT7_01565 [Candidatus Dormibacteria bacterium]